MLSSRAASSPLGSTPLAEEDSFHVRSTYARLDVVGVTGDGYEEGIERTRERSKLNRKSVARFGKEVDGLDEVEKRMRGTLDRYARLSPFLKSVFR